MTVPQRSCLHRPCPRVSYILPFLPTSGGRISVVSLRTRLALAAVTAQTAVALCTGITFNLVFFRTRGFRTQRDYTGGRLLGLLGVDLTLDVPRGGADFGNVKIAQVSPSKWLSLFQPKVCSNRIGRPYQPSKTAPIPLQGQPKHVEKL